MTNDHDTNADDLADDLFLGPDPSIAEEEAEAGEQLYADGPSAPIKKRGRGRPTLEEVKRRKVRDRVRRFRAKQTTGIHKTWQDNLAQLSEEERMELFKQRDLCSSLQNEMNKAIVAVANNETDCGLDCELVYQLLDTCIKLEGFGLVTFWCPDESAHEVTADEWEQCDDGAYRDYGLRTRLVRLFFREFLRWANRAMEANPADVEPGIAEELANLLVAMDPPKENRCVPEPVKFVPERQRQEIIRAHEELADQQERFQKEFAKWQLGNMGLRETNGAS